MSNGINSFSEPALAVMVHKLFSERVQDYLLTAPGDIPWVKRRHGPLVEKKETNAVPSRANRKRPLNHVPQHHTGQQADEEINAKGDIGSCENTENNLRPNVELLASNDYSGHSQDRKGFFLLLVKDFVRPIHNISPMARKSLSFAAKITHKCSFRASDSSDAHADNIKQSKHVQLSSTDTKIVARQIWKTLPYKDIPTMGQPGNRAMRIDVYPKFYTEAFCLGLQQACHETSDSEKSNIPTEPFEGPIAMTMSSSKCSHRLTILVAARTAMGGELNIYWGLMERQTDGLTMSMKVNQKADEDICVVAPDLRSGGELCSKKVAVEAPLSRAYYKLDQVWNDYLEPDGNLLYAIEELQASVVDFGSAPGGWTQILAHRLKGLKTICSVDRGILADRVRNMPKVLYVYGILEDCQMKIEPYGPFGLVVCDASSLWDDVMQCFKDIVVHRAPRDKIDNERQSDRPPKFTLPCAFVITLKLPFRRQISVRRQIRKINESIPEYLSDMARTMYPNISVQTRSTIAHLMANSDGERTLIAIFEESD